VSLTASTIDPVAADTRIDAFHELLCTLGAALDVRDVFQRLSEVIARIISHDEANLALLTEDGSRFRLYASTKQGDPELLCPGQHWALHDPDVPRVFDQGFGANCSFKSGLRVPVRVDGRPIGVLALLSRKEDTYSDRELRLAGRVADYVAIALSHQRLAESARRAALERDRAANLESSVELLRAIASVLDIRTVFPRVSEIANKVLPHDRMTMSFDDGKGEIVIQACSNDDFAHANRIRLLDDKI